MFHYRWQYEDDIEKSSRIPLWTHLSSSEEAPRILAWVQVVDAQSGNPAQEDAWMDCGVMRKRNGT